MVAMLVLETSVERRVSSSLTFRTSFTTPRRSNSRKVCSSVAILSPMATIKGSFASPLKTPLTNSKAPSPALEFVFLSGF